MYKHLYLKVLDFFPVGVGGASPSLQKNEQPAKIVSKRAHAGLRTLITISKITKHLNKLEKQKAVSKMLHIGLRTWIIVSQN